MPSFAFSPAAFHVCVHTCCVWVRSACISLHFSFPTTFPCSIPPYLLWHGEALPHLPGRTPCKTFISLCTSCVSVHSPTAGASAAITATGMYVAHLCRYVHTIQHAVITGQIGYVGVLEWRGFRAPE